jgi:hypothetical protein
MIEGHMLKTRMKRVADRSDHAVRHLAEIEASVANLSNEDLLDLADIFKVEPPLTNRRYGIPRNGAA